MQVPSGQIFYGDDLELLRLMVEYEFIRYSDIPIELNSGVKSHVYVSGRDDMTGHPDLEWAIGRKIAKLIQGYTPPTDKGQPCLIGIPTAGTPFAQAAAMVSYSEKIRVGEHFICHRIMKEVLKEHGVHPKWTNGDPAPHLHTYWLVDNTVTDGEEKTTASGRLLESKYPTWAMPSLIFVDRQQGGIQNMEKAGFKRIVVAYRLLDITFAFGELGLWPKEAVRAVEEEIKAHQLLK